MGELYEMTPFDLYKLLTTIKRTEPDKIVHLNLDYKDLTLYQLYVIINDAKILIYDDDGDYRAGRGIDDDELQNLISAFKAQLDRLSNDDKYRNEYLKKFSKRCLKKDEITLALHYLLYKNNLDTIISISDNRIYGRAIALLNWIDIMHLELPIPKKEKNILVCLDEEQYNPQTLGGVRNE